MKIFYKSALLLLIASLLVVTGCDSAKPVTTYRLEKLLPDSFGDWVMTNTVRNSGVAQSIVTGYYQNTGQRVSRDLGDEEEIRIVIEDWGGSRGSAQLPVVDTGDSFDYHGLTCNRGFQPGSGVYEVRISIENRVLIKIEYHGTGINNEIKVLDAINWDALQNIIPGWQGLSG